MIGIIEIGSNNTKTHIYENGKLVFEESKTIEFKKHYLELGKIYENDWIKLDDMMQTALKKTKHIHVFGCSIFRILPQEEIERINQDFKRKYQTEIEIVTQEDEAHLQHLVATVPFLFQNHFVFLLVAVVPRNLFL